MAVQTTVGEGRFRDAPSDDDLETMAELAPLRAAGALGTRAEIEAELDDVMAAMRTFVLKPPDQVMREVAAYSARLSEITVLLHRVEGTDRQYTRVRTMQVTPIADELVLQFRIASRLLEQQRQDLELVR